MRKFLIALFVLAFAGLALQQHAHAAIINAVQHGSSSVAISRNITDVAVSSVNISSSILIFSYRVDDADPGDFLVYGNFTNSTNIQFRRVGTGTAAAAEVFIEWHIAEFSSGVSVEHGTSAMTAVTNNKSISAVNTSSSFPVISYKNLGTIWGNDDSVRARFTNSTLLELQALSALTDTLVFQAVDYAGAIVQNGTFAFTNTSAAFPITGVNLSKSFVIATWDSSGNSFATNTGVLVNFTNSTLVYFERVASGITLNVAWYVVEFVDNTTVQTGMANFSTTNTMTNVSITSVNTSRALAFFSGNQKGGTSPYNAVDNPGPVWFTANLTNATNLAIIRNTTRSQTAKAQWFVVEFGGPAAAAADTTPPALSFISPTPANSTAQSSQTLVVNVSHTEANTDKVRLYIDGALNQTLNYSGTSGSYTNFTVTLAAGAHNYTVLANDTAGNVNTTEVRLITVDATVPSVTDLRPVAGSTYNTQTPIEIAANVTDGVAVDRVIANITLPNSTVQQATLSLATGSKYNASYTIPSLAGLYNVTIIANDTAGNANSTQKTNFTATASSNAFPTWSGFSDNSTGITPLKNTLIQINVTLSDDVNLSAYIFSWNDTGSFVNDSSASASGTSRLVSLNKTVTASKSSVIGYRFYFNDSINQQNSTDVGTFTVKNSLPAASSVSLNSTTGNNLTADNLTVYWTSSDSDGDAIKNITNWYKNSTSITTLNMPFEGGSNSTFTKDYSGYSRNGTVSSAAYNSTGGYDGRGAYEFNGINTNITGIPNSTINRTEGSIEIWAKVSSFATTQMLVWAGDPTANGYGGQQELHLSIQHFNATQGYTGFTFWYGDNDLNGEVAELRPGENYTFVGAKNLAAGQWYHVVVTWKAGNETRMYVNGTLAAVDDTTGDPAYLTSAWQDQINIGKPGTQARFFNGTLDELRIYNRTLSAQQVQALYDNRTDRIVSQELSAGDAWSACITPNDGTADGAEACSNNLTVAAGAAATDISFTIYIPADNATGSDASGVSATESIVFNTTVLSATKVNATARGGAGKQQNTTNAIFRYENTGNTAVNITLAFGSAPACSGGSIVVKAAWNYTNYSPTCSDQISGSNCTNITTTAKHIANLSAAGARRDLWLWADFSSCSAGLDTTQTLNHTSVQGP